MSHGNGSLEGGNLPRPVILFALAREHLFFLRQFPQRTPLQGAPGRAWSIEGPTPLLIVETGIGSRRTRDSLEWLEKHSRPTSLIFAGFAGGLDPSLTVGQVLAVSQVLDEQGGSWIPTFLLPNLPSGVLLTAKKMIATPEEKQRQAKRRQAQAVDMESADFARWCRERELPWACVRVISDDAHTGLSPRLVTLLAEGRVSPWRMGAALIRQPSLLIECLRLARNTRLAAWNLSQALLKNTRPGVRGA